MLVYLNQIALFFGWCWLVLIMCVAFWLALTVLETYTGGTIRDRRND